MGFASPWEYETNQMPKVFPCSLHILFVSPFVQISWTRNDFGFSWIRYVGYQLAGCLNGCVWG